MVNLYFSGAENLSCEKLFRDLKVKYLLFSFLHLKDYRILKEAKLNNVTVMVDSGAHTLQKGKEINYDKFVDRYINFINNYSDYIDCFVELDIENVVGLDRVEEWTEKIIKETGRQPIVVWHKERGWKYWKEMCKKYDYVGFSGFVSKGGKKEVEDKYLPLFLREAKKHNTKVHGFGLTRFKVLDRYKFESVDSLSWKAGSIYGVFYYFNEYAKRLEAIDRKEFRGKYGKKLSGMNNFFIDYWNLSQWLKYAESLEEIK